MGRSEAPRYAVPRSDFPGRPDGRVRPEGRRYDQRERRVYNNYNVYVGPRPGYPYRYRYGAPAVGFYYYDPYPRYRYDNRVFGWFGGYGGYGFGYPTGELRLDVQPTYAQVYVDGAYAGIVDDFDGFAQSLRLEEGPYAIDIVAPGFETLSFDVRIQAGRRIEYRGDLFLER